MAKSEKKAQRHLAANFNHGSPSHSLPPIGVFWDIENCQVPKGKSAMAVAQVIRKKFFGGHREAEFMCVCDISKENKEVIQELNNAQVTVVHINATCKNAADDKLRQSMRRFADIHGHPATIVLISGDVNFAADLSDFHHRRHLRVIVLHNNYAPEPLLACAHACFNFSHLVAEIPFRTPVKQPQHMSELVITNLPSEHSVNQVRSRLKQLSDNCGGRVTSVNHRSAIIRFPTNEAAARAKKRMDKEDVFGSKIAVNFPTKSEQYENGDSCSPGYQASKSFFRCNNDENCRDTSPSKTFSVQSSLRECSPGSPSRRAVRKTIFPPPPSAPTVMMDASGSFPITTSTSVVQNWSTVLQHYDPAVCILNNLPYAQRSASTSFIPPQPSDYGFKPSACDGPASPQRYLHWKPLVTSSHRDDPLSSRCSTTSTCSSDTSRDPTPAKCVIMDRPPKEGRRVRGLNRGCSKLEKDSSGERYSQPLGSPRSRRKNSFQSRQSFQERTPRRRLSESNSRRSTPSPCQTGLQSRCWTLISHDKSSRTSMNGSTAHSNGTAGGCGVGMSVSHYSTLPLPGSVLDSSSYSRSSSPLASCEALFQPINSSDSQPVELLVTNLDQNIDAKEMKKLLLSVFRQHVMVLHVAVMLNPEGNLTALVKVPSMQDAQYAISQLHRRKIGFKRILISFLHASTTSVHVLRSEIVALLTDVPGHRLPLFKFRELFEKRYHQSISVSDLYKLKDVVVVQEESNGRMVCLNPNYRDTPSPASSEGSKEVQAIMEKSFCELHCPNPNVGKGWAEKESSKALPNVCISLKTLAPRVHMLIQSHNGVLPLGSFTMCYQHEFEALDQVTDGGVPLEHLIASVPGVQIGQSASGGKRVQWTENKNGTPTFPEMRSVSPPLAAQLALFSREVVDLVKSFPRCVMSFNKFIPAYHHHFGRQCRVADYGYTKLIELFEAVAHIIQIMGEGNRRLLTLTHRTQVKRFTSDLLRVLKSQASKQVTLAELPPVYAKCLGREFDVVMYGVCDPTDLLCDLAENSIVVTGSGPDMVISITKREQTPEEVERTKQFAVEVVELLRHSPQCRMNFSKFIPAYHHHFGQQCRVADFGFTKLIELFEAIPDVLEVHGEGDDKWLVLTERELLKVLSDQLLTLIRSTKEAAIPLHALLVAYTAYHGHSVNLEDFKVQSIEELLAKIKNTVKVIESNEGPLVTLVDRGYVRQLSLNARRILMEQPNGRMPLAEFSRKYLQRFSEPCNVHQIRNDLENVIKVEGGDEDGVACLVPLQMFARNVHVLLHDHGGRIPMHQFDAAYLERFGMQSRPAQYGFPGLTSLIQAIPDVAHVRGKGQKKAVLLNRDTAGTPLYGVSVKKISSSTSVQSAKRSKMEKRSSSADSAVVEEDDELLQNSCSPVDLLSDPVPSGVPSPCLQPCPFLLAEKDLIRFDSPVTAPDVITGSVMSSKCPSSPGVSTQDSLVNALLRALVLSPPLPPPQPQTTVSGAIPGASALEDNMAVQKLSPATRTTPRSSPAAATRLNSTRQQQVTSTPTGTPVQLDIGLSHLDITADASGQKSLMHSCEDLAVTMDTPSTSSQSTPCKGRPRARSRIAALFTNPVTSDDRLTYATDIST